MASGNKNKNIKHNPDLFTDEVQTTSETILDKLQKQKKEVEINHFSQINKALSENLKDSPEDASTSIEEQISFLLDKYYNGDRDVDISQRYAHKAEYKQELIATLKSCGIEYVEKPHYPLSRDEKHIIRMDFFGTINRPHYNKLTPLYQGYLHSNGLTETPKSKVKSKTKNKKETNKKKHSKTSETNTIPNNLSTYSIDAYDLSSSPSWQLFRLFPRFHKLENRMLKTIQSLHIPPEQIKVLSVYDFSDLLYRTFRKSENSSEAHLFLGARQAFIKDIFLKNEQWIRNFLTKKNVHPRYIETLIKSAQSKGITGNINIISDANTYMREYAIAHANELQKFIIQSIKSDNYANDIRTKFQSAEYLVQGPTLNFLLSNQENFEQHIKKRFLETNYLSSIYKQFNRRIPSYVMKDVKTFLANNYDKYIDYLKTFGNSTILDRNIQKHLPNLPEKYQKIINSFIFNNQNDFFISLIEHNRSAEYANFALSALQKTPQLTDYSKEIIQEFINLNPNLFSSVLNEVQIKKLNAQGLSDDILNLIAPTFEANFDKFKTFFKNNNVLTIPELQHEFIESTQLNIKTTDLSVMMEQFNKNFIMSNTSIFKNWYIHFHTQKYKEQAQQTLKQIANNGINKDNLDTCRDFLNERINNFVAFAIEHKIPSKDVIKHLQSKNPPLNSPTMIAAHDFILQYSSTFKNYLLQNRLKAKENNFEIMLKQFKQHPTITGKNAELVHKFIIDNQAIYTEALEQNKLLRQQIQNTYSHIINNKATTEEKALLSSFLNENIYNYLVFQQNDTQLQPYTKNIINNIKQMHMDPETTHWLKEFTISTQDKFKAFMHNQGPNEAQNSNDIFNSIKFENGNMIVKFSDRYNMNIEITAHHLDAIKDTGNKKLSMENIASINNFNNLCAFISVNDFDDAYKYKDFWHKVMHSLDSTEPYEDKERFVSRLIPADKNIIIFGGENDEDKLSYDYTNDPRTQRSNRRLANLVSTIYGQQQCKSY